MEEKEYGFFDYFNSFQQWLEEDNPTDKAVVLYMKLFCMMNRRGWQGWAKVDTKKLILLANATNKVTAYRARDELVRAGLIEYKPGKKGKASEYHFLCKKNCKELGTKSFTDSFAETEYCKESDTESFTDSFTESFTETEKEREKRKKEAKKEIKREKEIFLKTKTKTKERESERESDALSHPHTPAVWKPKLPEGTETRFSGQALAAITEWLTYKHERREDYKLTGIKSVLTQIEKKIIEFGEAAVIDVIQLSMANNWKGIIWDRIKPTTGKGATTNGNHPKGNSQNGDDSTEKRDSLGLQVL